MSKKINIKALLTALILLGAGCDSDRLDVEPVNEFLSDNYYQTEEQVFSSLVAAYDPLGWSMAYGQWISYVMYGEIRSDNANAGGDPSDNDQPGWQEIDDLRETNTNTVTLPIYRRNYIGIFRANLVLSNAQIESALVERYKAEAKFLRAFYHFELLRTFGPIPVVTEPLKPDNVNLSRNTMTEVFTAIVTDLEEAINVLPVTLSSSEAGRASKGSAQALLGKVYLYWADMTNDDPAKFQMAEQYLSEVVTSGQYQLEDDFGSLFSFGAKNSVESVFEIQHSNLYPSDWGWFEGIDGNGIVQLCGIRGLCDFHPDYQAGWGFMMITEDLYNTFLPSDSYRRTSSIASDAELQQDVNDAGLGFACATAVDPLESNPTDYTGYWQVKFANYKGYEGNNINGGDPNLTKDANTYAIRYADVLLMLAEAMHRGSGNDNQAMMYIDMVRERGAGPGDNTGAFTTAQQVMNTQGWSLLELIQYERRVELACEGDRWFDLVRSGRVNASLFSNDPIRSANFDENDLWLPISLEETSVANGLTTYPDTELFN